MTADTEKLEIVVAHHERVTVRVGEVFLEIDVDQTRTDVEIDAMAMAPVTTPEILWRKPPVLALAALPGRPLGRLEEPSTASSAAWAAAGATIRTLHDAPPPPWPGRSPDELAARLDRECEWLVANEIRRLEPSWRSTTAMPSSTRSAATSCSQRTTLPSSSGSSWRAA